MKEYKSEYLQLYNCCNMELMSQYPDNYFDLAIVDPPYGNNDAIGLKDNASGRKQATNRKDYKVFENTAPPKEYFSELRRVSKNQIVFCMDLSFEVYFLCLFF